MRESRFLYQRPNEDGGFDFGFGRPFAEAFASGEFDQLAPVMTVWMSLKPVGSKGSGSKYVRGEQVNENVTHVLEVMAIEVASLGREFSLAFSSAFKFMPNLVGLKSTYYLFVEEESSVKGRLFRIHEVTDHKEEREFLIILAEEIEERGVGHPV